MPNIPFARITNHNHIITVIILYNLYQNKSMGNKSENIESTEYSL